MTDFHKTAIIKPLIKVFAHIFIISFLYLNLAPLIPTSAAPDVFGVDCEDHQIYVTNGRILVVQHFSDIPVDLLNKNSNYGVFEVIGPDGNIIAETNIENWSKSDDFNNRGNGYITYTIDQYTSKRLVQEADAGVINISFKFLIYGEDSQTDKIHQGSCDLQFDPDQFDEFEKAVNNGKNYHLPLGACSGGCDSGLVCKYKGTGEPSNSNSWGCQKESLAAVDFHGKCGLNSIDTALGCLPADTENFTLIFVKYAVGLAGFSALIIMLIATITILTGGSNPEQVKKGKELFTSAIMGLLFIIFSAVILKIINQDLLGGII